MNNTNSSAGMKIPAIPAERIGYLPDSLWLGGMEMIGVEYCT